MDGDVFHCESSRGCPLLVAEWGRVVVRDPLTKRHAAFKDVKVWPGGARGWNWKETGTRHQPGTQVADVDELLPPKESAAGKFELFLQVHDSPQPEVLIVSR